LGVRLRKFLDRALWLGQARQIGGGRGGGFPRKKFILRQGHTKF